MPLSYGAPSAVAASKEVRVTVEQEKSQEESENTFLSFLTEFENDTEIISNIILSGFLIDSILFHTKSSEESNQESKKTGMGRIDFKTRFKRIFQGCIINP